MENGQFWPLGNIFIQKRYNNHKGELQPLQKCWERLKLPEMLDYKAVKENPEAYAEKVEPGSTETQVEVVETSVTFFRSIFFINIINS